MLFQPLMEGRDIFEGGTVDSRSTQQHNHTADERVEYEHIPQPQVCQSRSCQNNQF